MRTDLAPPTCPTCLEVDNPELRHRRNFDGVLHVNCRCCGYDRCQELPVYRVTDDWAGGYCVSCRDPEEVAMRARNAGRAEQLRLVDEELAKRAADPAVVAYLAAKGRREAIGDAFERMRCDDSFG